MNKPPHKKQQPIKKKAGPGNKYPGNRPYQLLTLTKT
jgi:hypothetical protein